MIYALHGHFGSPSDWLSVLRSIPSDALKPFRGALGDELWNIYNCVEISSEFFAKKLCLDAEKSRRNKKNLLLGYSLGGRLALEACVQSPEVWDAVVIVSADPGFLSDTARKERSLKDKEWSQLVLEKPWPDFWKLWCAQEVLANSPMKNELTRPPADTQNIAAALKNFSLGQQSALVERLHQIRCPVLWVYGEKDLKYKKLYRKVALISPSFLVEGVANAGHRVLHETPEILAKRIGAFLQGPFQASN